MGWFDTIVDPTSFSNKEIATPGGPLIKGLRQAFGIDRPGNNAEGASDILANLYRSQWSQYLSNYGPLESAQVGLLGSKQQAMQRQQALGDTSAAYASAPGQLQRQAFAYGAPLSTQDLQSYKQQSNTQKGLADASAYNSTVNNQTSLAFGGVSPQYSPAGVGLGGSAGAVVK